MHSLGPCKGITVALVATSLDLLLDPFGLDLGLWEWSEDGPYAPEVKGPNGKRGIPMLNIAGWITLSTGVTLAYQHLRSRGNAPEPAESELGGVPGTERTDTARVNPTDVLEGYNGCRLPSSWLALNK
jgi:hypothetical protein